MSKIEELQKEISRLSAKLDVEIKNENVLKAWPAKHLAVTLHNTFCTYNHADGCGWYYEVSPNGEEVWESNEHRLWLRKANAAIQWCHLNQVNYKNGSTEKDLVEAIEGIVQIIARTSR